MTARVHGERVSTVFLSWRKAFRPLVDSPEQKVLWTLRGLLGLFAAYGLAVREPPFTSPEAVWAPALGALAASVFFAFLSTDRPRTLARVEAVVLGFALLHVAGQALGLYVVVPFYDKALHLLVPLLLAGVLYVLPAIVTWPWRWRDMAPGAVALFVGAWAFAFAGIWELVEFATDAALGTKSQKGLADTMIDQGLGLAGATVGALGAWWHQRRAQRDGDATVDEERDPEPRGNGASTKGRKAA